MAGRPKKRLKAENAVKREQSRLHQERLAAAMSRIKKARDEGKDIGDVDDELLTVPEIQAAIADPIGESPRLWRTELVRCADPEAIPDSVIVAAIHRGHGIVSVVGRLLGVTNKQVYEWINEDREFKTAMAEARESMVDLAECRLFEACNRGEAWAVHEVLHCLGTHRGWVDNKERPNNRGEILDAIDSMLNEEPARAPIE